VLDYATCELAVGTNLDLDASRKLPGKAFHRPWPPLIKMDDAVNAKVEKLSHSPQPA
jgi:3-polyprenyl-4-hydroxybenzoate decarboxylase